MSDSILSAIQRKYETIFSSSPKLIRAPGRINLIGEHTDYNEGFVFPAAVGHEIVFGIGKSGDKDQCSVISLDFDERFDMRLSELKPIRPNSWQNYIMGVAAEIIQSGKQLEGFNLVFSGNIPQGSGISSSAALECGTCFGLSELFGLEISKLEMIKLSQKAEHNYAGVKCGIMDQFASIMGVKNKAFRLDCRNLTHEYFPIELKQYSLVLINSNVTHDLASSEYNVRREQCEEGIHILSSAYPEVKALRDASIQQLVTVQHDMTEVVYKRCKYVIEENQRVNDFSTALSAHDLTDAGAILMRAQRAMKEEYDITCPEIDFMADFANIRKDVLGARMMGGGFGGCTINIIQKGSEEQFISALNTAYQEKFRKEITPIPVNIAEGVSLIEQK